MDLVVILVFVGWVTAGLALGWLMGRRGFDAYTWALFGVVLGPIAIALAVAWTIHPPAHEPTLLRQGASRRAGALDVLVGWDGSPESHAALAAVDRLVGDRIGRLTLAHVVPFDASAEVVRLAETTLAAALDDAGIREPAGTVLLRGLPAVALRDYAGRLGYDVLAVGTRGEGRSHALLGSVASTLVRGAGVPIVLADAHGTMTAAA